MPVLPSFLGTRERVPPFALSSHYRLNDPSASNLTQAACIRLYFALHPNLRVTSPCVRPNDLYLVYGESSIAVRHLETLWLIPVKRTTLQVYIHLLPTVQLRVPLDYRKCVSGALSCLVSRT